METVGVAAIAVIGGLVVAVVNSIFGPHVLWSVEKRKKQFDNKRELITKWRQMIVNTSQSLDDDAQPGRQRGLMFYLERAPDFWSLHPHLSQKARQSLFGRVVRHGPDGSTIDGALFHLAEEVSRIEREWSLIGERTA